MDQPAKLNADSLGIVESAIIGIAGTAPVYSIEITTSTIIGTAGTQLPANILVCGLITFDIAYTFINMNRALASVSTSYSWVSMVFGRALSFSAGWALLVLCCVFMVSVMIPAANATLLIFGRPMMNNMHYVTLITAVWLTFVSVVVVRGIKLTSYVQVLITIVEGVILLRIIVASFMVFPRTPQHPFSWIWLQSFAFTPKLFANGALVAIFFFYDWDVTMNPSEETRDTNRAPGRAVFWSMVSLMVFFSVFIVITQLALSDTEIRHYNTNIIFAIAEKLFGSTWDYVTIVAALLSTVGTVETQMLQLTRTLSAKSCDSTLHARYTRPHPAWRTLHIAIFFIWLTGLVLLFVSSYLPTINVILHDSIIAVGFQTCFYLGFTGLACGWYYRKVSTQGPWAATTHIIWPVASGPFLFFITFYSIPTFDWVTNMVGMGGIVIGVIPLLPNHRKIWSARFA